MAQTGVAHRFTSPGHKYIGRGFKGRSPQDRERVMDATKTQYKDNHPESGGREMVANLRARIKEKMMKRRERREHLVGRMDFIVEGRRHSAVRGRALKMLRRQ